VDIASIETYLKRPYRIYGRISTTVSYGFASAVATRQPFDAALVAEAIVALGQDPAQLRCVYCDDDAQSWDHLNGMVDDGEFSGFGHVIGNLVPACARCNSQKGNRDWRTFVATTVLSERREVVETRLSAHEQRYLGDKVDLDAVAPEEMQRYRELRSQTLQLLRDADAVAAEIREKTRRELWPDAPPEGEVARRDRVATGAFARFYEMIFERTTLSGLRRPTFAERGWQPFRASVWGSFWIWLTEDELRIVAYLGTVAKVDKRTFNKAMFDGLKRDADGVAGDLGQLAPALRWDRLDHRQASWVGLVASRPDFETPTSVDSAAAWAAAAIDALVPAVETRLRALVPGVTQRTSLV
jgi:hypothetical protein